MKQIIIGLLTIFCSVAAEEDSSPPTKGVIVVNPSEYNSITTGLQNISQKANRGEPLTEEDEAFLQTWENYELEVNAAGYPTQVPFVKQILTQNLDSIAKEPYPGPSHDDDLARLLRFLLKIRREERLLQMKIFEEEFRAKALEALQKKINEALFIHMKILEKGLAKALDIRDFLLLHKEGELLSSLYQKTKLKDMATQKSLDSFLHALENHMDRFIHKEVIKEGLTQAKLEENIFFTLVLLKGDHLLKEEKKEAWNKFLEEKRNLYIAKEKEHALYERFLKNDLFQKIKNKINQEKKLTWIDMQILKDTSLYLHAIQGNEKSLLKAKKELIHLFTKYNRSLAKEFSKNPSVYNYHKLSHFQELINKYTPFTAPEKHLISKSGKRALHQFITEQKRSLAEATTLQKAIQRELVLKDMHHRSLDHAKKAFVRNFIKNKPERIPVATHYLHQNPLSKQAHPAFMHWIHNEHVRMSAHPKGSQQ